MVSCGTGYFGSLRKPQALALIGEALAALSLPSKTAAQTTCYLTPLFDHGTLNGNEQNQTLLGGVESHVVKLGRSDWVGSFSFQKGDGILCK